MDTARRAKLVADGAQAHEQDVDRAAERVRGSSDGTCNLLYTGVTRGKRLVVLVGQRRALAIAVKNANGRRRWSKLRDSAPETQRS